MKKTIITLTTILLFTSPLISQIVDIPDIYFLDALLDEGVDANEDGQISYTEAEAFDSLNVSGKNISDMTGIEAFVNIEYLDCSTNQLDSLDMSSNDSLIEFRCNDNVLKNLILSGNTELRILNCTRNTLNSLNVSENTVLDQLHCEVNFLNSLDVSNNLVLSELYCGTNILDNLNVTKNLALKRLACSGNNLTILDMSKNVSLEYLNFSNNQLTGLDLSKNTSLSSLECIKNELTNLDLSNNAALTHLICHDNQLVSIDVSNVTTLIKLDCRNNQLCSLDISMNTDLEGLNCCENYLTSLDISNNTLLGVGDEDWQSIYLCNNPTLSKVCVWTMPFPPANVKIFYQGSPNVYFTTDCSVGIEETNLSILRYYPNPANNLLTIDSEQYDNYSVIISALNGQLLLNNEVEGHSHEIDLSSFQKGIYLITIRSKNIVVTEKFIKL